MTGWHMVTILGRDRPGIVAAVSQALYEGGVNLGEASMARLGGAFAIMVAVQGEAGSPDLRELLAPLGEAMDLKINVEPIDVTAGARQGPDVTITVFGADRAGIVAQVSAALAQGGLNILDLRTDIAGTEDRPIYVMQIDGRAERGLDAVKRALAESPVPELEVTVQPLEPMIG